MTQIQLSLIKSCISLISEGCHSKVFYTAHLQVVFHNPSKGSAAPLIWLRPCCLRMSAACYIFSSESLQRLWLKRCHIEMQSPRLHLWQYIGPIHSALTLFALPACLWASVMYQYSFGRPVWNLQNDTTMVDPVMILTVGAKESHTVRCTLLATFHMLHIWLLLLAARGCYVKSTA